MDLSNVEIDRVLKKHRPNLFLGTMAFDEFDPSQCPFLPIAMIVNTEPISVPSGGHWVVLYVDSNKNGIFFDSFGHQPWSKFRLFLKKNAKKTVYNKTVLQSYDYTCGHHAVFFVMNIAKKKSLQRVLNSYKSHSNPDQMVASYFRKISK